MKLNYLHISGAALLIFGTTLLSFTSIGADENKQAIIKGRVLSDKELVESRGALSGPCLPVSTCKSCNPLAGDLGCQTYCDSNKWNFACSDLCGWLTCIRNTIPNDCGRFVDGGSCMISNPFGIGPGCFGGVPRALNCPRDSCSP
jgi:hypothetical protein